MGAGFISDLTKRASQQRKARERLGMEAPPSQRSAIPPINPSGPGAPDAERPAQQVTQTEVPATTPATSAGLGPVPPELQNMLGRVLNAQKQTLLTEQLRRVGTPGADSRHHFFNLFGHMPTSKELAGFSLRLDMEKRLGRPPTVQEVKQALRGADFIDRNPEPFGMAQPTPITPNTNTPASEPPVA